MATTALIHRGLKTWWDSMPFASDFDGPHDSEAPADAAFPCVVFSAPSANLTERGTENEYWRGPLVLSIYDRTKTLCETHLDTIDGDDNGMAVAPIPLLKGRMLQLRRTGEQFIQEDEGVYKVVAFYDAEILKPRQKFG